MRIVWVAWLVSASTACGHALSTEVYRWTDERGHIHYGDAVPDRYAKDARRLVLPKIEVRNFSEPQPASGSGMTANNNQRAIQQETERRPDEWGSEASETLSAGSSSPSDPEASCEDRLRQFRESQECFAPFRLATGGIKVEAFEQCTEILQPDCALESTR